MPPPSESSIQENDKKIVCLIGIIKCDTV